jgi:hypothetical protein
MAQVGGNLHIIFSEKKDFQYPEFEQPSLQSKVHFFTVLFLFLE